MARARLTDAQLRRITAEGEHAVGGVPGLVLRVRNGVRTLRLRYRNATGSMRNLNLGIYPDEVSLKEARGRAGDIRRAVRGGRDPAAERAAERAALRMVDLFGVTDPEDASQDKAPGWFLGTYVHSAGRLGASKTPKGIANDRSAIKTHLRSRSALMRKAVSEVTLADLNQIKRDTTASTWRKLRNILLVSFRHAEEIGTIPPGSSPVARTKATSDRKRERYLDAAERQRVEAELAQAEELGPTHPGGMASHLVQAIRILALTGMRRGEVVALRWEWIDFRHGIVKLPESKTGAKNVPLTPQAVAFFRELRGTSRRRGLVCQTEKGNAIHPENMTRGWLKIRKRAEVEDVRLHDLRHSWASDAVSAGVPLYVVGAVLGHKQPSTTARYAHLHDQAIQDGLTQAGNAIERATQGSKPRGS